MRMVDTDVLVDVLRGFPPAVAWLDSLGDELVVCSGISALELVAGAANLDQAWEIEAMLAEAAVAWPDSEVCTQLMAEFPRLRLRDGLGIADFLIACTAVSLDEVLHTHNQRHFRHIPGLRTARPYRR